MTGKTRWGTRRRKIDHWHSLWLIACLFGALSIGHTVLEPSLSPAQVPTAITPTAGAGHLGTQVTQIGNSYDITGGTQKGPNLFHSFGLFSVGGGDIANFNNTAGLSITNILSRVTGGQPSNIYGTIQTTNFPGANLFLFNPAGVVFGPGASLNVSGSFHVSTADYVKLADGAQFFADPSQASVLTTAPPTAFGFLGPTAAPISIQGSVLQVPEGQTLSVVGGDIQITGGATLTAPSGRVQIASVGSAGEVQLVDSGGAPTLDVTSFSTLGQIEISGGSVTDASDVSGIGGGTVVIRGGRLMVDSSQISANTLGDLDGAPVGIDIRMNESITLTNGTSLLTTAAGAGRGGDVQLTANQILIDGSSVATSASGDGNAGNLSLSAPATILPDGTVTGGTLALTNGASVGTTTFGLGRGGDVLLFGQEEVTLAGGTGLSTATFGDGRAGDIAVNAGSVTLRDGSAIASFTAGGGAAGDVTLNANDFLMSGGSNIGNFTVADGAGGKLLLSAQTATLDEGAFLISQSLGAGAGGDLAVNATRNLTLTGGAFIKSETGGALGGNILVTAGSALISDSGSGIFSGGSGGSAGAPAGNISVTVGGLTLTADGVIQNGTILDRAGNIAVAASESIVISNGGKIISQAFAENVGNLTISTPTLLMDFGLIQASTIQTGNAGDILVNAGTLNLSNGAQIVTSSALAATGRGGNLTVTTTDAVSISGRSPTGEPVSVLSGNDPSSGLFSTASLSLAAEAQGGGRIAVTTPVLTISDGGKVSAFTPGAGPAGDIALTAHSLTLTGGARIDSSTTSAGAGGAVKLTAMDGASSISIAGVGSGLFSTASSTGNAGQVTVATPTLSLSDGSKISVATSGADANAGKAGDITLNLNTFTLTGGAQIVSSTTGAGQGGTVTLTGTTGASLAGAGGGLFSTTQGSGDAGQITVATPTLTLGSGAQIASSSEGAATTGRGGSVTVNAPGAVSMSGVGSGLLSTAEGSGNAGQITVTTPALSLSDGSTISVATSGAGNAGSIGLTVANTSLTGGARIDSSTTGAGQGGTVTVNAAGPATISSGAGLFSTAEGRGAGGDLNIRASELQLLDGAIISAKSLGTDTALAGNVNIVAGSLLRMANSTITTQAAVADGGNISIITTGSLLQLTDSQITTSVGSGVGKGGNITIGSTVHPLEFILFDGSQVRADAFGGPGGNINIFANVYLTSDSVVSASSALSTPGTIAIQAQVTNVSGSLTQLPTTPLEAAALLRASCGARLAGGKSSSLVLAGREGLPLDPGGLLPSPLLAEEPVAALSPGEKYPWLENLLKVSQMSLVPDCSK